MKMPSPNMLQVQLQLSHHEIDDLMVGGSAYVADRIEVAV